MEYFVKINDQQFGPYSLPRIKQHLSSGNVLLTDLVRTRDMADWVTLSELVGEAIEPFKAGPTVEVPSAPSASNTRADAIAEGLSSSTEKRLAEEAAKGNPASAKKVHVQQSATATPPDWYVSAANEGQPEIDEARLAKVKAQQMTDQANARQDLETMKQRRSSSFQAWISNLRA